MADTILTAFLTAAGTTGVFGVIFKIWFEHEYRKKLAEHTARLTDRYLRSAKTFDKTADVIATTYKKLVEYREALNVLVATGAPENDPQNSALAEVAWTKAKEFRDYYLPNKIYLPREAAKKAMEFSSALNKISIVYSLAKETKGTPEAKLYFADLNASITQAGALLTVLEDLFQSILGLSVDEKKPTVSSQS